MGLDMYVFRVSRLTDADLEAVRGRRLEACGVTGLSWFDLTDGEKQWEAEPDLQLRWMRPFMTVVKRTVKHWDMARMRVEAGVPDTAAFLGQEWKPCRRGSELVSVEYVDGDRSWTVFPKDHWDCFVSAPHRFGLLRMEQVAYWRKNYGLQDDLHREWEASHGDTIKNCGYYPLNDRMLGRIAADPEKAYELERTPGTELFYHEWY